MVTTGSKLFIGATVLSVVAAIVYAVTTGGPTGFMGTVGLISTAVVFAFLAGINIANRDGNVVGHTDNAVHSAAAQAPVSRSMWPAFAALGVAGLVVGIVSHPTVFKVSFVVLLAAGIEWMVQAWSERASADSAFNSAVRARLLHPLEFPILATVGLGAVIYAFSRVMLTASKDAGRYLFIVIGALILVGAFFFAARRNATKKVIAGISTLAAVSLVGVGVGSAVSGQREIEEHPSLSSGVCLEQVGEEEMHHADKKANTNVSATNSIAATIELQSNGTLIAFVNGYQGTGDTGSARSELQLPRGAQVSLLFKNNLEGEHRLTARLGTFGTDAEVVSCTARIEAGDEAFLSIRAAKTNAASSTPLELVIPDLPDQKITVVVP